MPAICFPGTEGRVWQNSTENRRTASPMIINWLTTAQCFSSEARNDAASMFATNRPMSRPAKKMTSTVARTTSIDGPRGAKNVLPANPVVALLDGGSFDEVHGTARNL